MVQSPLKVSARRPAQCAVPLKDIVLQWGGRVLSAWVVCEFTRLLHNAFDGRVVLVKQNRDSHGSEGGWVWDEQRVVVVFNSEGTRIKSRLMVRRK